MENLKIALASLLILVVAWFAGSAMWELVTDLYHFFAGILAFFLSLAVVIWMVQITIVCVAVLLSFLAWITGNLK